MDGHIGSTFRRGLQECAPDFVFIISGQKRIVNAAEDVKRIIFIKFCSLDGKNILDLRGQNVRSRGNGVDSFLCDHAKTLGQRIGYRPEVFRLEVPQVRCQ